MSVFEKEIENWHFFVTCSRCQQNCKTSHFISLISREGLRNVQKWNMHMQSVRDVLAISYSYTWVRRQKHSQILLPPRFSLTTCSSFLPFTFVGRNNFTWRHYTLNWYPGRFLVAKVGRHVTFKTTHSDGVSNVGQKLRFKIYFDEKILADSKDPLTY